MRFPSLLTFGLVALTNVTSVSAQSSAASQPSLVPYQGKSKNGKCGSRANGRTCLGSRFGDCCSGSSLCTDTLKYCLNSSCQKAFGRCGPKVQSSAPVSSVAVAISSSATPSSIPSVVVSSPSSFSSVFVVSPSSPSASAPSSTPSSPPKGGPVVLKNGGFEDSYFLFTGISGWTIPPWGQNFGGSTWVDYVSGNAHGGMQYAVLLYSDAKQQYPSLSQTVTGFDTSSQYVLTFSINLLDYNSATQCSLVVSIDETIFGQHNYGPTDVLGAQNWVHRRSFLFTPSSFTAEIKLAYICQATSPTEPATSTVFLDDVLLNMDG